MMFASGHETALLSGGIFLLLAGAAALRARRASDRFRQGRERRQWLEYAAIAERSVQQWSRQRG